MRQELTSLQFDKRVESVLDRIEHHGIPFRESDVLGDLNALAREISSAGDPLPECLEAECLAFHLIENCAEREDLWGFYHGPEAVGQNSKGERVDIPSLDSITPDIIQYWDRRARSVQHPILRARYADLVWDFRKRVCGQGPDVQMAHIVVDDNITMVQQRLHKSNAVVPIKLRRALGLALSIGDTCRIDNVRRCILSEQRDGYWYVWVSIYDELLWNKRSGLSHAEREQLIKSIEDEFNSAVKDEKANASQVEGLSLWLASYYRRRNEMDHVRRVLNTFAAIMLADYENVPAMTSVARCEMVYEAYRQFNLNAEAEALLLKIEKLSANVRDEMGRYSQSFKVPDSELQAFLDELVEGTLEAGLRRIAVNLVEYEKEARKLLPQLAQSAPLTYLCKKHITNEGGVVIAAVGSLEDDEEGNIFQHMATTMQLSTPLLRMAFEAVLRKHSPTVEELLSFLYESPVYDPSRRAIIMQGLSAYLNEDCLVAVHLLIPQVEAAVRNLATLLGSPVYRSGRRGGFQLRNLDELLQSDAVETALGRQQTLYLRVLLTDQRGWNLRNEVSHGVPRAETFDVEVADRIFHALLVLAMLRANPKKIDAEQTCED